VSVLKRLWFTNLVIQLCIELSWESY
jgi:hypothetical protein